MNRLVSSRMLVCRAASLSVRSRPITQITQTTIKQTVITEDSSEGITETFVTSDHKVGVVTQKEVIDGDGNIKRQTIPPQKWDADLASTSEEIIKAERRDGGKDISMEKLQKKSLKGFEEKEQKLAKAKKTEDQ